jgi:dipeptidyl aminopeptidase/acylaminoacyl peptidase
MFYRLPGMLFMLLVFNFISRAQDGKIVDQTLYTAADSTVQKLRKIDTTIEQIVQTVNFYRITYLSDGLKVKGYLAVPKTTGKYPCVIFNRGGNREFGAITDDGFFRMLGKLAASGYVIAASQYRGNSGGEGKEEFGGKDLNDVLNLISLFSNVPQADTSRIGMFGWSRGGMMTYLALTKTTTIKAAVIGSGLTDLITSIKERPELEKPWAEIIPDYATQKTEVLKQRSAVFFADKICKTTPILILQGTADWRVSPGQVLDLVNKLYQNKQPFRFILYEGGQHSLVEHRTDYYAQLISWFNTYLRDRKKWPDLEPHGD